MTPILTTTSTVMCQHGGLATLATTNTEAAIDGAFALLLTDIHPVAGCPFAPGTPSPCVSIQWVTGAAQTKLHEVPVLLQDSVGLCFNALQAPQGKAIVAQAQQKALGI